MVAAIKRRIEAIRAGEKTDLEFSPSAAPKQPALWSPDDAFAAIQNWAKAVTDKSYLEHFHGEAPVIAPLGDEAVALGDRMLALSERRFGDIVRFDEALVEALSGQGIEVALGHPAIPNLRGWFGNALLSVESHSAKFRQGDFSKWSLESVLAASGARPGRGEAEDSAHPLDGSARVSALLEKYIEVIPTDAKDESEMRGYVRRLIEHLGDIPIRELSTIKLDGFLVKLRRFPVTKRPDILRLAFDEIVDRFGDIDEMPKLANKTIRTKWFGAFNRLVKFAVSRKMIRENPVTDAMPRKRDDVPEDRDPWTREQVGEMFAKPLFTGASSSFGNRDKPGTLVERDAKYWIPLIALWSGMRLDEIGATRTDEVKHDLEHDIWYFDLTSRPLRGARRVKNPQSQRRIPLHRKLIDLGFIDYVQAQGEWLFPDLPHDGAGPSDTTKQFSKWFGRWWRANGLLDPAKNQDFHSLRHSFKDECREARIAEDVHDRLTGHAGSANQQTSRKYGHAEITLLSDSMNTVDHPIFPMRQVIAAATRSSPSPMPIGH